jgi:hypothetical protein
VASLPEYAAENVARDYATNARVTAHEAASPKDIVSLRFQILFVDPARFFDAKAGAFRLAGTMPRGVRSACELAVI